MAPQPYEQKSVTGVHHLQCASLRPAAAGQFFEWGGAPVQPYDLEVRRQYISAFMAWMGLPDPSPELIETCRNEFCEALSIRGHKEIGATIFEYRADSIVWQERSMFNSSADADSFQGRTRLILIIKSRICPSNRSQIGHGKSRLTS